MRKLMWFAVGFAAACASGIYLLRGGWILLIGLFCLICCAATAFLRTKPGKIAAMLLFGCVIGFTWLWAYDSLYLNTAREYDGETVNITISASDYSYEPSFGQAFDGKTVLNGKTYRVRCYLNEDATIKPGDTVRGEFRLQYTVSDESLPGYQQGKGIFLVATLKGDFSLLHGEPSLLNYPALLRQKIISTIEGIFPIDTYAFAKALLIGDTTSFTYEQDRDFQVSGLRHVVAVSGLHVSILFALIYMVSGRHRIWNTILGIPLLLIFAAIAGFTPSIVRACTMQCIMLLSMLVDKEYDPPTSLAFAVLVILGINPHAVTSVSFQLSVGCMIGIFAFSESLRQYFLSFGKLQEKSKGKTMKAKLIRWFVGSVSVTLSAMSVTIPLCAIYFGMISLIGILANLLTLWIISFVFYGILLTCAAGLLWWPLGRIFAWAFSWPIRYVLWVSELLADFPLAAVYTNSVYIVFWVIFSYFLIAVFLFFKKKNPGIATILVALMLCVCIALSWLEPKMDDTRVTVIDVGQGQSVLLQHGGKHYLVDCGGDHPGITADTVANYLMSQGVFRLDGLILTHYDSDHANGVVNLLTCVDADRIYMPDRDDSNGIRESIESAYPTKIGLVSDITSIEISGGTITLYPGKQLADDNETSVCVLFQPPDCDILITGDRSAAGERALMKETKLPKLELLIAGHHGSHLATSSDLLIATRPQAVAISVGANNRYGHPRDEMLERLEQFDCRIYRTDLQGTIIFRR
jgi:competence protein ComEC